MYVNTFPNCCRPRYRDGGDAELILLSATGDHQKDDNRDKERGREGEREEEEDGEGEREGENMRITKQNHACLRRAAPKVVEKTTARTPRGHTR